MCLAYQLLELRSMCAITLCRCLQDAAAEKGHRPAGKDLVRGAAACREACTSCTSSHPGSGSDCRTLPPRPFGPQIVAFFLPPLAVFIATDSCGTPTIINILLTLLGWIPGIIHAIWILLKT
ncbi:hypothetical protein ABPG75_006867 [Micractinium tetrahymenae]